MAYNANIPKATDQLSTSQADILGNFQFLNTIASGIFDAPVQIAAPAIAAGDTGLYTLLNAGTGRNEMYIIDSVGATYPITAARKTPNGWTQLPSGLLMVWGQVNTVAGPGTFVYATIPSFPGFTGIPFSFQLSCVRTSVNPQSQVYLDSFTAGANTNLQLGVYATSLTSPFAGSSTPVQFLVIGV